MRLKLQNTLKQLSNGLLTALLIFAASSAFAQAENTVSAVSDYVTVASPNGDIKRLKDGDTLEDGDTVTTGEGSSVSITLSDGTVIDLGELSSYTIGGGYGTGDDGTAGHGEFAPRSLSSGSPTLSTATSAGGGISDGDTTPGTGGSPSN